jgi:hypothetical protein
MKLGQTEPACVVPGMLFELLSSGYSLLVRLFLSFFLLAAPLPRARVYYYKSEANRR